MKVLNRLESAKRRAVLFPQDGTANTAAPLTDVEVVIVKDRWVDNEAYWRKGGGAGDPRHGRDITIIF